MLLMYALLDHTNTGSSSYHHNKFIIWV